MSRIAVARKLIKEINAILDAMPVWAYEEVRRCYDGSVGLVYAIEQGWVTSITDDGLGAIQDMHRDVCQINARGGAHLAGTAKVGDKVTWVESPSTVATRHNGVITNVPTDRTIGFVVKRDSDGVTIPLNLFWNWNMAARYMSV